ncbi:MAG: L,D-transpeptidase [Akkermansia sp.]
MKLNHSLLLTTVSLLTAACSSQNSPAALHQLGMGYAFARPSNKVDTTQAVSSGSWDVPAGLTGPHLIVIDTELQQAKYYIGDRLVGQSAISSGKAGKLTPRGTFKILAKDATHKSSTYGSVVNSAGETIVADYTAGQPMPAGGIYKGAAMNNAMQLTTTGIWMHEGIVTSAPESHGCIRLPKHMAKIFFDNTEVGTPVIIK